IYTICSSPDMVKHMYSVANGRFGCLGCCHCILRGYRGQVSAHYLESTFAVEAICRLFNESPEATLELKVTFFAFLLCHCSTRLCPNHTGCLPSSRSSQTMPSPLDGCGLKIHLA